MITRIVSAVIAALLVIGAIYFFQALGLYVLSSIMVAGCIYEYSKLTLKQGDAAPYMQWSFMLLAFVTYIATVLRPDLAAEVSVIAAVIFLAMGVTSCRVPQDLPMAFKFQTAGLLGFFYVGLFPGFAIALLGLEHGIALYMGLLGIVFAGDTFAYFFGRFLGKTKLLEVVSPKKTRAGSVGGLIGSAIFGAILARFVEIPTSHLVGIAIVAGAFAQVGDLFESLVKRLADVKDSGRIMPGHGGFLDRLDGVLFAAPVFYVLLHFMTRP